MSNSRLHNLAKLLTSKIAVGAVCLIVIAGLTVGPSLANAAFNKEFNYQGKLTNASGVAVADGTYNMEFALYTASSGGTAIWTETRTGANKVTVTNGLFSVMLGEVTSLSGVDFNQTLYLGVNIGGTGSPSWDGEMTPRKRIGAVPAAVESERVGGFTPAQSATGNQLVALTSGALILGDTNPLLRATSTNTLTLQGGGVTGDLQFFSSSNKITSAGNLTLAGSVTLTAAPTTSSGSYDIITRNSTTGVLEKISSTAMPGGSGTTDYLARWTGTNTLGIGATRDDGTNVGIGTAPNASYKLTTSSSVSVGDGSVRGTILNINWAAGGSNTRGIQFQEAGSGRGGIVFDVSGFTTNIQSAYNAGTTAIQLEGNNGNVGFATQSGTVASKFFGATGNLSLGSTTDAGYKLDVNGTARITGALTTNLTDTYVPYSASGVLTIGNMRTDGSNYAIGAAADAAYKLKINGYTNITSAGSDDRLYMSGASILRYYHDGSALVINDGGGATSSVAIYGNITLSTAPTTSAGSYTILTRNSSTGVVESISSTTMPSGSGTTNYVARWTDTNTLGTGVIRDDGSTVGIGTAPNASYKLDVAGNIRTTHASAAAAYIYETGGNTGDVAALYLQGNSGAWGGSLRYNVGPGGAGNTLDLYNGSARAISILSSGNVGIGTTSPGAMLSLNGNGTSTVARISFKATGITSGFQIGHDGTGTTPNTELWNFENTAMIFGTNNAERMRILASGNVGIGDTSPAALFTVGSGDLFQVSSGGNVTLSTAPTTSAGTYTILTRNSSTGVVESISSTTMPSGSGTTDYLARWTGINTLGIGATRDDGTNVGIGVAPGTYKLNVNGGINIATTAGLSFISGAATIAQNSGAFQFNAAGIPYTFSQSGTEKMRMDTSGNLGIGTTSPVSKLHVGVAPTASANYGLVSLGSGAFDGSTSGFYAGSSSGTVLAVNEVTGYAGDLINIQRAGVSRLRITGAGYTGVGLYDANLDMYPVDISTGRTVTIGRAGQPLTGVKMYSNGIETLRLENAQIQIGATIVPLNTSAVTFFGNNSTGTNWSFDSNNTFAPTTGNTLTNILIGGTYALQSAGVANSVTIAPTYNFNANTTTSAIVRGIYYNPTITTIDDAKHRAIETVTGDVIFGSTSGSVGIGTTTPTSFKLEIAGSAGPSADNTYDLGSASRRWANVYATNIFGSITPTGFTQGSVVFAGSGGVLSQDNTNLYFDDTNNRLQLNGTTYTYDAPLQVTSAVNGPNSFNTAITLRAPSPGIVFEDTTSNDGMLAYEGGDLFVYSGSTASNTLMMRVSTTGVGIGGTATKKLDVFTTDGEALRLSRNTNTVGHGVIQYFSLNDSASNVTDYAAVSALIVTNTDGSEAGALRLLTSTAGSLTEKVRIDNVGNMGIGDTTPAALLTVGSGDLFQVNSSGSIAAATGITTSGNVTLSTAPTTSAGTYTILTRNSSTGVVESIASTTYAAGSGTTNYVARWTGTNTLGIGVTYDNGTNVGIGTTSPLAKFDIAAGTGTAAVANLHQSVASHRTALIQNGDASEDAFLQIAATNAGTVGTGITLTNMESSTDGRHWLIQHKGLSDSNRLAIGYATTSATGTNLATSASDAFTILTSGNVGIGTTSPGDLLHLNAASGSDARLKLSDGDVAHGLTQFGLTTDTVFRVQNVGGNEGGAWLTGLSDAVGTYGLILNGVIGVADPTDTIAAVLLSGSKKNGTSRGALGSLETVFQVENGDTTSGTKLLTILGSGNVGIGDTTPASLFTVGSGDLFQVNSSGAIAAATGITTTGNVTLSTAPATSAGTYTILTRNSSTGVVESIASTTYAAGSGTTNYVARWTGTNTLGTGVIRDDGSTVGIGTAPNASYALDVNGTVRSKGLFSDMSTLGTSNNVTILADSTNESGIIFSSYLSGVASGKWQLYRQPAAQSYNFQLYNYTTAAAALTIAASNSNATFAGSVGVGTSPSAKLHVASSTQNATELRLDGSSFSGGNNTNLSFYLDNASGSSVNYGNIYMLNETRNAGTERGQMRFYVRDNGTTAERMTILGSHVGIGTQTPNYTSFTNNAKVLTVLGGTGTASPGALELYSTGTAAATSTQLGSIVFGNLNGGTTLVARAGISGYLDGATNSTYLQFATMNAGTIAEVMRIDKSGNVGIGTASPTTYISEQTGLVVANTTSGNAAEVSIVGSKTTDSSIGSLSFRNDAASGARLSIIRTLRDGANNSGALTLWTNNAGTLGEAMRINPAGNVLIGGSTDDGGTANKLQLKSGNMSFENGYGIKFNYTSPMWIGANATADGFYIYDTTASSYRFIVNDSGNVGIGTTSPDIFALGSNYRTLTVTGTGAGTSSTGILELATVATDASTYEVGTIDFVSSNNTSGKRMAYIHAAASGATAANRGGYLVFATKANGTANATEAMRIDTTGYVGIGDTSPAALFTVGSGDLFQVSSGGNVTLSTAPTTSAGSYTILTRNSSTGVVESISSTTMPSGSGTTDYLARWTGTNTLGIGATRDDGTNVGIGVAPNSTYSLGLVGDLNIGGQDLYFNGVKRITDSENSSYTKIRPQNNRLIVYDGSNNQSFEVYNSTGVNAVTLTANASNAQIASAGTSNLILQPSSGSVGIGTTSPATTLQVNGAGTGADFLANLSSSLSITDARSAAADVGGGILFGGGYNGTTQTTFAGIRGVKVNGTAGDAGGRLEFFTRTNGDNNWTGDQRMVIDTTGNVGIGTTSPDTLLHIAQSTTSSTYGSYPAIVIDNANATGFAALMFNRGAGVGNIKASIVLEGTSTNNLLIRNGAKIKFQTLGAVDLMTLDTTTGNVGIGDTTPAALLTVGSGDLFQVNSSGAIAAATGITTTGNVTLSTAPTTSAGTYTILTRNSSTGVVESIASTTYAAGSGTTNYVARWTGTNTLGTGVIRDDGSTVGIGTAPNASYKLDLAHTTSTAENATIGQRIVVNDSGYVSNDVDKFGLKSTFNYSGLSQTVTLNNIGVQGESVFSGTPDGNEIYTVGVKGSASSTVTIPTGDMYVYGFDAVAGGNLGSSAGSTVHAGLNVTSVTGTARANYGIYIGTVSGASSNFALWSGSSAPSYFSGNVTTAGNLILSTAPTTSAGTYTVLTRNSSTGVVESIPYNGLAVTGSGTTGYMARWTGTGTIGAGVLYDDGTNIGIGTTSPGQKLEVRTDDGVAYASNGSSADPAGAKMLINNQAGIDDGGSFIEFQSKSLSGVHNMWYAGTSSAASYGGPFIIGNRTGAATYAERFRISSDGNVGIGISGSNPSTNLQVNTNTASTVLSLTNSSSGLTATDGLTIQLSSSNVNLINRESGYLALGTANNENIRISSTGVITLWNAPATSAGTYYFLSYNPSTGVMEKVDPTGFAAGSGTSGYVTRWTGTNTVGIGVIRDDGTYVGIGGAPNSSYKLDVNGTARVQNTFTATTTSGTHTFTSDSGSSNLWLDSAFVADYTDGHYFEIGGNNVFTIGTTSIVSYKQMVLGNSVARTSGTNTNTAFSIETTINNTGGTNTVRGLYYNPTTTSLTGTTHIAIETTKGDIRFGTTSGAVSIGNTNNTYKLEVGNNSVSGIVARFVNSTGTCDINPTTTALSCSSDERLKKNITTLDNTILDKILALRPVTYNWNSEQDSDAMHGGFIAQEVEELFPDLVSTDPNTDLKALNYMGLIPYTIKAVQEMNLTMQSLPVFEDQTLPEKVATFLRGIAERGEALVDSVKTKKVQTQELCVGDDGDQVCVTKDQLRNLLQGQGTASATVVVPAPTATPSSETASPSEPTSDAIVAPETVTAEPAQQESVPAPAQ